jgi:hypothetical protein
MRALFAIEMRVACRNDRYVSDALPGAKNLKSRT